MSIAQSHKEDGQVDDGAAAPAEPWSFGEGDRDHQCALVAFGFVVAGKASGLPELPPDVPAQIFAMIRTACCDECLPPGMDPKYVHPNGGHTLVHSAAVRGHHRCIEGLKALGADIDKLDEHGNATPLHYAAHYDHPECIRALHQLGADVNGRNNGGKTPLHSAAYYGHPECIRTLHSLGADVNGRDGVGRTPLHHAAYNGHKECIRTLQSLGAHVLPILLFGTKDKKTLV